MVQEAWLPAAPIWLRAFTQSRSGSELGDISALGVTWPPAFGVLLPPSPPKTVGKDTHGKASGFFHPVCIKMLPPRLRLILCRQAEWTVFSLQFPTRIWELAELSFGWSGRPTSLDSEPIIVPQLARTGWGCGTCLGVCSEWQKPGCWCQMR